MSDRTSAEACGNIINLLSGYGVSSEIIQRVCEEFMVYDFSPYQTRLPRSLLDAHRICSYCGGTSEWPCCEEEGE